MVSLLTFSPGYFLLADSFYTTLTVVMTLQNEVVEYNLIQLNYLAMVSWASEFIRIYGYWTIQHTYNLKNKTMFCWIAFCILVLDLWGLIGIWTRKIGFYLSQTVSFSNFEIITQYHSPPNVLNSGFEHQTPPIRWKCPCINILHRHRVRARVVMKRTSAVNFTIG